MAVTGISPIAVNQIQALQSGGQSSSSAVDAISQSFSDMLDSLTVSENTSNALVTKLSLGEDVDLHDVMIGMEQTDIQFRVATAIRDKLVDAYRQMMQMQV